jgi:prepilin-type N-terminal cleavage/methylation domain-containing protein
MYEIKICKKNAYTLFEVIVTTIILAVLASLAIPRYTSTLERTKAGEGFQILESLLKGQNAVNFANGAYATNINQLDVQITSAKFFDVNTIVISSTPANLASITRKDSVGYSLRIDSAGIITCFLETTSGMCNKIGCRGGGNTCN